MAESRNAILKSFHQARTVPAMHLIEQFINPGKKDAKNEDAKQAAADEKDNAAPKPMLTREEAFSRLQCRIEEGLTADDHVGCKNYLQKLNDKWSLICSSNEKLILGLAYKYGLGGIPKKPEKALKQFKSAVNKDENNGYALVFVVQSIEDQKQQSTDEYHKYSWQLSHKANPCGPNWAREGALYYRDYLSTLSSNNKSNHPLVESFYEHAQSKFEKAAPLKHYLGLHNLGCMYAIHKDKTKHPEGEVFLKAAIAQGCSDSIAAYAQYYIAEADIRKEWLVIAEKHGSGYAARQIEYDAFASARECAYSKKFSELGYLVNAAACFRLASILVDKQKAQQEFKEMTEINYRVQLFYRPYINSHIMYHYGLAFDNAKLDDLLKDRPEVFVKRWKDDYNNPRHLKMKEQAITFVLQIDPAKLSSKANGLLATALAQCSEKALKDKAGKFSTEIDIQKKVAAMDAKSAAALPALSLMQQAGAQGATFDTARYDVEATQARDTARLPVGLQLSLNTVSADVTRHSPKVS